MAIYTSDDGGSTWDDVTYNGTTIENLKEVMVTKDGSNVNLLGDNGVFTLTDIIAQDQIDAPLLNFQNKKIESYLFAINKDNIIYKVPTESGDGFSTSITGNYYGTFENVKCDSTGTNITASCYNSDDHELYIFTSFNSGNTWEKHTISSVNSAPNTEIFYNPSYVFIKYGNQPNFFLRRSINSATYSTINLPDASYYIDSFCTSSGSSYYVYIGTYNSATSSIRIYYSTNGGTSFGYADPSTSLTSSHHISKISCSKDGEHVAFVMTSGDNIYYNFYYSKIGEFFSWRSSTESSTTDINLIYDNINKNNTLVSTGSNITPFHLMKIDNSGQYIIASESNKIYVSSDFGETWNKRYELPVDISFDSIDIAKQAPNIMIAAAAGYSGGALYSYLLTSTNYGITWASRDTTGLDMGSLPITVSLSSSGDVSFISSGFRYYYSNDLFANRAGGFSDTARINWGHAVGGLFPFYYYGIFRFLGTGACQIGVRTYTSNTYQFRGLSLLYIDIKTNFNGMKTIACTKSSIYVSTDLFVTYITRTLSAKILKGVSCDYSGNLMAAYETNGQVWISTDTGNTWSAKITSLRNWTSVVFDGQYILASNDIGEIWKSEDQGNTWITTYEKYDNARYISMTGDGNHLFSCEKYGPICYSEGGSGFSVINNIINKDWVDLSSSYSSSGLGTRTVYAFASDKTYNWSSKTGVSTWVHYSGTVTPLAGSYLYSGKIDYNYSTSAIKAIAGGENICIYSNGNWATAQSLGFSDPHSTTPQYRSVAIGNNRVIACSPVGTTKTIYPGSGGDPYQIEDGGYLVTGSYNGSTWTWNTIVGPQGITNFKGWADVAMSGDGTTWFACLTNGTIYVNKNGVYSTISRPWMHINSISTNYTGNAIIIGTTNTESYYTIGIYNSSTGSWSFYEQTGLGKQVLESSFYSKHSAAISDNKLRVLTEKYYMTTTDETNFTPVGSTLYVRYSNKIKKFDSKFLNGSSDIIPGDFTIDNLQLANNKFYSYANWGNMGHLYISSDNCNTWTWKIINSGGTPAVNSIGASSNNVYYLDAFISNGKYINYYNQSNNSFGVLTPKGSGIYGNTTSKICGSSDGTVIYIYDQSGYLYKSIDSGKTFSTLNYIYDISLGEIFSTVLSFKCNGDGSKLIINGKYLSINGGISFSKIIPPEGSSSNIGTINESGSRIFIVTSTTLDKIYYSDNNGGTWAQIDTSFGQLSVKDIDCDSSGNNIAVAIYNSNIYKSTYNGSIWSAWADTGLGVGAWLKILINSTGATVIGFTAPHGGGTLINVSGDKNLNYITEDLVLSGTYYSRVYEYPSWTLINQESSTVSKPISFVNYNGTKYYSALLPLTTGKSFEAGITDLTIEEINLGLEKIKDINYINDNNVYYSTTDAIYDSELNDLTTFQEEQIISEETPTIKTLYIDNIFTTPNEDNTWKFITVNDIETLEDENNVISPLPISDYFWKQTIDEAPGHYFENDESKRILSAISKSITINNEFKHYIINCYKHNTKIGNNKNGYFMIQDDGVLEIFIPNIEIFCINEGRSTLNVNNTTAYFGEVEKEFPIKFINKNDMSFNLTSMYCIPSIPYFDETSIKLKVESDKQCKDLCNIRITGRWK